jgi:hypothetical protein
MTAPVRRRNFCGSVARECARRRRRLRTAPPGRRRTSSPGSNATPTGSKARRIGPATAGTGARRSASKSSIALALTEAADASFATDQPSRARAERHWAAEIIASGRAEKLRKWSIVITVSVSRHPHNKSRCDKFRAGSDPASNKDVVKPVTPGPQPGGGYGVKRKPPPASVTIFYRVLPSLIRPQTQGTPVFLMRESLLRGCDEGPESRMAERVPVLLRGVAPVAALCRSFCMLQRR